jgi:hypothetical protein
MAPGEKSIHAGADFPALAAEANATAFEQVRHGGDSLAVVFGVAADGHDEITKAVVGSGRFLKVLFHTNFGLSLLLDSNLATLVPRADFTARN